MFYKDSAEQLNCESTFITHGKGESVFPLTLHLAVQKGAKSITSGNLMCLLTFRRLKPALKRQSRGKPHNVKMSHIQGMLSYCMFQIKVSTIQH